jgi:CubicO group peptidase (beta-lactamase class C family)
MSGWFTTWSDLGRGLSTVVLAVLGTAVAMPVTAQLPVSTGEMAPREWSPERQVAGLDSALLTGALARASEMPRLYGLIIARGGEVLVERMYAGPDLDTPVNIKSVSKSVTSALIGIAISEGYLRGTEQPITPFFMEYLLAGDADPRKRAITVGNLLSMQPGLQATTAEYYTAWLASPNWVQYALSLPLVDDPGGRMIYSSGTYHILSALLTQVTGRDTWTYAREKLAEPLGIDLQPWPTDPQGIPRGGSDMRISARGLLRFGELYRNGGVHEGRQVVPADWVRASWQPQVRHSDDDSYGYGWWLRQIGAHSVFYASGLGGQFVFVVPDLELTVVATAVPFGRSHGHPQAMMELLRDWIIPAAAAAGN